MSFVENIRLPEKHIKSMLKGKPISIKPEDVMNGVVNSQMYFSAKKDLARLRRNLAKNKSTRLNGNHVQEVMVEESEGSGIYSPLRNYEVQGGKISLKGIGKSISKGFKSLGNSTKSALKTTGKVLNKHVTPILADTARQMAPVVGQMVGELTNAGVTYATGNPAAGKIAGKVTGKLSENAYKKEVAPRIPKGGSLRIKPQQSSTSLSQAIETQPSTYVGSRLKSFSAPMENTKSTNVSPQEVANTKKWSSPAERMAYVRGFKGKKTPQQVQGGSFLVI